MEKQNQTSTSYYFIFYGKITLWPISYVTKTFAAKTLSAKVLMAKNSRHSRHHWACSLFLIWWAALISDLLLIIHEAKHLLKCFLPLSVFLSDWFLSEKKFNILSYIVSSRKCSLFSREYVETLTSWNTKEFRASCRKRDYSFQQQPNTEHLKSYPRTHQRKPLLVSRACVPRASRR